MVSAACRAFASLIFARQSTPTTAQVCKALNAQFTMNRKYTKEELANIGDEEFPSRGEFCKKCKTWIPQFEELDEDTETRVRKLINEQKHIMAMRELEAKVNCNHRWSKIWVIHKGKPTPEYPGSPCPHCGGQLRTSLAKQCPHCFKSWHNEK